MLIPRHGRGRTEEIKGGRNCDKPGSNGGRYFRIRSSFRARNGSKYTSSGCLISMMYMLQETNLQICKSQLRIIEMQLQGSNTKQTTENTDNSGRSEPHTTYVVT